MHNATVLITSNLIHKQSICYITCHKISTVLHSAAVT